MEVLTVERGQMLELAKIVAEAVVTALKSSGTTTESTPKQQKTAYQKTEALLFNYRNFKKIVEERMGEIEDIRKHGVPAKFGNVEERVQTSHTVHGIVLPEESVENAVRTVEGSVQGTVQAIALIDKSMAALRSDPYYKILEMLYFEGRTQEDIALEFGCSQFTISTNKTRLVKELAMRLFPNQVIEEMMQ